MNLGDTMHEEMHMTHVKQYGCCSKKGSIGVMFSGFSQKKKLLDSWTGNDALSHLRVDFEAPQSLDV